MSSTHTGLRADEPNGLPAYSKNEFQQLATCSPVSHDKLSLNVRHGHEFNNPMGQSLDLHWHVVAGCCYPGADREFWDMAISISGYDVPTKSLCPTDQLLHVCVHGAKWNSIPSIRWVADAFVIVNSSSSQIDWNRLSALADRFNVSLPLK
ncbi:MAG: nucleotidyltransferase family protein, partial [Planctomycetota bacterium]